MKGLSKGRYGKTFACEDAVLMLYQFLSGCAADLCLCFLYE